MLRNIVKQHPNKTCIVTTHRPSVLNLCQRVYRVLETKVTELSEEESSRMAMDFLTEFQGGIFLPGGSAEAKGESGMVGKVVGYKRICIRTSGDCRRRKGGFPCLIAGSSMSPFLCHNRDYIYFTRPDRELRRGDMVFLSEGRRTVCDAPHIQKKGETPIIWRATRRFRLRGR